MATISFRVSDEEKRIIFEHSKKNNITVSEFLLRAVLAKIEDEEDYLLGKERMSNPNNKVLGTIKELAEMYAIDYDNL